jgi:RND family efflux transporter MFP subunit
LLAVLGAALASCSAVSEAPAAEQAAAAPVVRVERLELSSVGEGYEAVGSIRSRTTSTVSSKIVGAVTAVQVQEGDKVRSGQVLMELDDREVQSQLQKARAGLREAEDALDEVEQGAQGAQAALQVAEANRELAEATYNRYSTLRERNAVSPQEFDEVHARFKVAAAEENRAREMANSFRSRRRQVLARIDQARADVKSAENYASDARIEAPFDGIVTAKHADVGTMASPGVPLLTLEDDRRYRFEAVVEESRVGRIRAGDRAEVRVDAVADQPLEGKVAEIVPTSDPASRSVVVKIDLAQASEGIGLRSGFFGRASFSVGERQALLVPRAALVQRGQLVGVYVLDRGGIARLRLIKTGKDHAERVEVLSGLEAGDAVVVEGAGTLSDGTRVEEQGT